MNQDDQIKYWATMLDDAMRDKTTILNEGIKDRITALKNALDGNSGIFSRPWLMVPVKIYTTNKEVAQ